ncbi:MAG: phospholipase D family protein [Planctomycetia bacterium]|nr:phospholipase D family protein [Planctomycetia bacterium]
MTTLILLVCSGFAAALVAVYWGRMILRRFIPPPAVHVHFSPKGGCGQAIVDAINASTKQILVMAYSFTYDPIVKALMDAHDRGVDVEILFDRSNEAELRSDMPRCMEKGLKVLVDGEHAIAHNKLMIIDQKVIITGSFNFTRQAEDANAENLLIIRHDKKLVEKYLQYYENHKVHSRQPQLKEGAGSQDRGRDGHKKAA